MRCVFVFVGFVCVLSSRCLVCSCPTCVCAWVPVLTLSLEHMWMCMQGEGKDIVWMILDQGKKSIKDHSHYVF